MIARRARREAIFKGLSSFSRVNERACTRASLIGEHRQVHRPGEVTWHVS